MKRIKITVLLILLCVLAGCSPKDTSLRAYCTESQQEFLDQSLEELPVALTYRHNDNILGRYETTDEEIISEILQALRETTIVSKAFSGSTAAGSWSLRQRMGIPASSGLMKTGSMAPAEHPMCFPATRRFGIWRGKSKKHIHGHPVHACRSFVSDDLQICHIEVIIAHYLLHETSCVHALFPFCPFCLCRL